MPKLCEYENCRKRASYGRTNGNLERCKEHSEDRPLARNICKCGKFQPLFNEPGNKIPICCSKCKSDTMTDVRHKRCVCKKSQPLFNEPGETTPICCSKCKTDTMIDIQSRRCVCKKSHPLFNEPGETTPICCSKCKTDTMVNVKDRICVCKKSTPSYNEPGETIPICCFKCKTDTMINVKNKTCFCKKSQPVFNEPGETTPICCSKCKTDTMINVKDRICVCKKSIPSFNIFGEKTAICCTLCKTDDMIDIKHKLCPGQDGMCTTRGNKKYKGYCAFCFQHQFPDDPLTFQIRCKTKELAVRTFIDSNFKGFIHDKQLSTAHCDCSIRRRPDHRIVIGNTILCIEDDENGHKSYSKMDEETRYDDLYMAFSGKWVYIRFNPDKYIDSKGKSRNPQIGTRLVALKKEIEKQIDRINNEENIDLVERVYMYYDEI